MTHAPTRLSVSAVRDYQRCPRYYYLARVAKVPEDFTKHQMWAGSVLHACFQLAYAVPSQPDDGRTQWAVDNSGTLQDCLDLFEMLWEGEMHEDPTATEYTRAEDAYLELKKDKHMAPPDPRNFAYGATKALKDKNHDARSRAWKEYYLSMLTKSLENGLPYEVISVEHEVRYTLGDTEMLGYIDLVLQKPDGKLVYVDLKSGARCPSDSELAFDDQMNAYYTASYNGKLPEEVWYSHMKTGTIMAVPKNLPMIESLEETVPLVMASIHEGDFRKRPTSDCAKCSRRKSCMGF